MSIVSQIHKAWNHARVRMSPHDERAVTAVLLGPEEMAAYEHFVSEEILLGHVNAVDIDAAFHGRPIRRTFEGKEIVASATPGIRFARVIMAPEVPRSTGQIVCTHCGLALRKPKPGDAPCPKDTSGRGVHFFESRKEEA
jgi:hypothetical protein